jgi:hypothetical protein
MTIAMQPIYTRTITTGGSSVTFNSIPQTFTDLQILISGRGGESTVTNLIYLQFNGVGGSGSYSTTRLSATGSAAYSDRSSGASGDYFYAGLSAEANATANTFGNTSIYIPNYTGTQYKQIISDTVGENNATATGMTLGAGLIISTNPITSMSIGIFGGFVANSTVSLYGITKG